jgi:hypothetical protein
MGVGQMGKKKFHAANLLLLDSASSGLVENTRSRYKANTMPPSKPICNTAPGKRAGTFFALARVC